VRILGFGKRWLVKDCKYFQLNHSYRNFLSKEGGDLLRNMATMYCVKCRAKRDDPDAKPITMKNGKPAMQGKCPVCGTGMFKIGAA
jgi:hypothetical protein